MGNCGWQEPPPSKPHLVGAVEANPGAVRIFGIADGDGVGRIGGLDAVVATTAAAALVPGGARSAGWIRSGGAIVKISASSELDGGDEELVDWRMATMNQRRLIHPAT
jgi:hypothetical protein